MVLQQELLIRLHDEQAGSRRRGLHAHGGEGRSAAAAGQAGGGPSLRPLRQRPASSAAPSASLCAQNLLCHPSSSASSSSSCFGASKSTNEGLDPAVVGVPGDLPLRGPQAPQGDALRGRLAIDHAGRDVGEHQYIRS